MGCPTEVIIGDNLTFSVTTHDPDTGVVTDASAVPDYWIYEDETGTSINTNTPNADVMAKLDDAHTTGFYAETIECSAANGFESGKTYTVYIEATVNGDKGAICYGFKAQTGWALASDVTTAHATTDALIGAISVGAGGLSVNASGVTITTGTPTNAYTDTFTSGTIHIVAAAGGVTLFEYEFDLSDYTGTAAKFIWTGYVQAQGDSVDIQYYNWPTTSWLTIKTLAGANGTTLQEQTLDVPVGATGTGANFGLAKLRFTSSSTTNIGTDRVRCEFSTASGGITNGSTITLSETQTNKNFVGENWNLDLGGQDISGSYFAGATVTGVASASSRVVFEDCRFGACTVPPGTFRQCGFGESDGLFTAASAGEYIFELCYSIVAGSGTPDFTFAGLAATTGVNNRGWFGGSNYTLDSDCTVSHEVVGGGGQTFTTGGGDVELRGRCRSVTLVLSGAGTVQAIVATGPITISGTATTTVNLYGQSASLADTSSGTTVTDSTISYTTVAEIVADTNELQADDIPGTLSTISGYVDCLPATLDGSTFTSLPEVVTDSASRTASKATGFSTHSAANVYTEFGDGSNLTTCATATGFALASLWTEARAGALTDWIDGERLDLILDAILAMLDDARAEPGQGAPAVNPDAMTKLDYLYKAWRNKATQTASAYSLYADDGTTVDQAATISDDATTATKGEIGTGA